LLFFLVFVRWRFGLWLNSRLGNNSVSGSRLLALNCLKLLLKRLQVGHGVLFAGFELNGPLQMLNGFAEVADQAIEVANLVVSLRRMRIDVECLRAGFNVPL